MRVAVHPRLYDPLPEDPVLSGVECGHCGRVYFPPVGIGCEICGATAEQLAPKPLAAAGIVFAVAEVYLGPRDTKTPFTIAEIALDGGPLIRAMVHPESASVRIGDRVCGRWNVVDHDAEGSEVVEPAFVVAASTVGAGA